MLHSFHAPIHRNCFIRKSRLHHGNFSVPRPCHLFYPRYLEHSSFIDLASRSMSYIFFIFILSYFISFRSFRYDITRNGGWLNSPIHSKGNVILSQYFVLTSRVESSKHWEYRKAHIISKRVVGFHLLILVLAVRITYSRIFFFIGIFKTAQLLSAHFIQNREF